MNKLKIGLCQMMVTDSKKENLKKAVDMIEACAREGVDIAVLPEMFICPYDTYRFKDYAENMQSSETLSVISETSKYNNIYVVAGSIPELCEQRIYNTSLVFNRDGQIIGKHRKKHLFDIDIKNGIAFKESAVLSGGTEATVVSTEFCKIGIAICFDIRFSEFYQEMSKAGAKIIITPGAFNMTTGPAHWELLGRARAVDNQLFHVLVSSARNNDAGYIAYGNSLISDPWGKVIARADEKEQLIITEINLDLVEEMRKQIPIGFK